MRRKILFTSEVWKEGNMYTSYCPELDVASCGYTPAEAERNLREAVELFLEEAAFMGTLEEILLEAGYDLSSPTLRPLRELVKLNQLELTMEIA